MTSEGYIVLCIRGLKKFQEMNLFLLVKMKRQLMLHRYFKGENISFGMSFGSCFFFFSSFYCENGDSFYIYLENPL